MEKSDFYQLAIKHITGELDEADNKRVEKLINENNDFRILYNELATCWNKSKNYKNDILPDREKAFKQVSNKIHDELITANKNKLYLTLKIAATIVMFIGISFLLYSKFNTFLYQEVYSSGNSTEEILLPDSTRIYLNQNSTLTLAYGFNRSKRKVRLEGVGFFNVTKNIDNPFIVKTKYTTTKVLGTSFNLDVNSEETSIHVYSGKVSFGTRKNIVILKKGMAGKFNNINGSLGKYANYDVNANAWHTKKLVFKDAKLEDVLKTIAKTYNIELLPDLNLDVADICFTGQFNQQSCEEVLDILALTLNLKIINTSKQYYLVKQND